MSQNANDQHEMTAEEQNRQQWQSMQYHQPQIPTVSEAPAEVWLRRTAGGHLYGTGLHDEPDAVRYVRADLYEALMAQRQQEPLGELGRADYPR